MAATPGKNTGLKWATTDITSILDKASLERMRELIETTVFSSSANVMKSRIAGVGDAKVTAGGPADFAVLNTSGIEADADAGTARALKLQADCTQAASTSNPSYTATMLVSGFKLDTTVSGAWTWSADFELASGVVTKGTSGAF
ncbi:MAG TPA: hypothetical protein VF914_21030 [Chloroflexia bacterium]|jgi:hypothetical protein